MRFRIWERLTNNVGTVETVRCLEGAWSLRFYNHERTKMNRLAASNLTLSELGNARKIPGARHDAATDSVTNTRRSSRSFNIVTNKNKDRLEAVFGIHNQVGCDRSNRSTHAAL